MAKVGAQRAAELTGVSKSTIQRAMGNGKLSFEVDNGRRLIDVSELERVFGLLPQGVAASSEDSGSSAAAQAEMELERTRHAMEVERLTMKARMLEDQLDDARRQLEDMRAQRDLWQRQAQQVLLTSQHSQKQADERIAEMQSRDESRAKALADLKARQAQLMQQRQEQQKASMVQKVPANAPAPSGGFFSALFGSKKGNAA